PPSVPSAERRFDIYSLLQSARIRGSVGVPLPNPFKALSAIGTELLRGQLALVAAGPGTGKSAFVLTWALLSRVPCMYFSADSDNFTQFTRALSIVSGRTLEESAKIYHDKKFDLIKEELAPYPIRFNYAASPTLDDIQTSMQAYEEVYGDYPALVVIDNVTNVVGDGDNAEDPFSGLESLMDYLATMARETESCVVGTHHVTGPYNDANKPIPLSGIKGQISRVPSMVLTLHKKEGLDESKKTLCVSTVKNRGGKADPSGEMYAELMFEGDRMQIRDFPEDEF